VERQARKRVTLGNGGEKARGRKDGRGVAGWRLIFCSLASASSSASGRPHFARAARLRVERDHPSSCPSFRSRPTLLLPLFIFLPFAPRTGRFRSLAFAASTSLENACDNDVISLKRVRRYCIYLDSVSKFIMPIVILTLHSNMLLSYQ